MAELLLPNAASSMAGARLLPSKILEAMDLLEIRHDVQIKWSGGYRRTGAHRFLNRFGIRKHVITVSTHLDAESASSTLWHELTHAHQLEGFEHPEVFYAAYSRQSKSVGYKRNRFEVEARDNADAFKSEFPLASQVARRTVKEVPKW